MAENLICEKCLSRDSSVNPAAITLILHAKKWRPTQAVCVRFVKRRYCEELQRIARIAPRINHSVHRKVYLTTRNTLDARKWRPEFQLLLHCLAWPFAIPLQFHHLLKK